MDREQAFQKAALLVGDDVVIGENEQRSSNRFYVGKRRTAEWIAYGEGNSWEEALLDYRPGKPKGR